MNRTTFNALDHGIYEIHWKDGGTSIAAVGSLPNGERWLAPINWTIGQGNAPLTARLASIKCAVRLGEHDALQHFTRRALKFSEELHELCLKHRVVLSAVEGEGRAYLQVSDPADPKTYVTHSASRFYGQVVPEASDV